MDGFGRTIQATRQEQAGTSVIETRYDPLGRVWQVSQPSFATPADWTTTTYDALDRPLDITVPDGSVSRTRYAGREVLTRDPAGKWKKTLMDAAGRLDTVVEDPVATIDTFSNPAGQDLETSYEYDGRGLLTKVIQGAQTRTFVYDGLGLLLSALNPESGLISYSYDPAGNLITRTDARSITATMRYDRKGRLRTRTYSDLTPPVTYCYDGATGQSGCTNPPTGNEFLLKGRLTMVSSSAATTKFEAYDSLGRVTASRQEIPSVGQWPFGYSYNHQGLNAITYPSGRMITTAYDDGGRASAVGGLKSGQPKDYATGLQYAVHGGLAQVTLGNGKIEQTCYNNLLQASAIRLGAAGTTDCANSGSDLVHLALGYGTGANNGNIVSQAITVPNLSVTQNYSYDALNRIQQAEEPGNWSRIFDYDRYGNLWVSASSGQALSALTPITESWYKTQGPNPDCPNLADGTKPDVCNRIIGVGYDAAGNQQVVNGVTYSYDAENRMTRTETTINGTPYINTYAYDGDGRRVSKTVTGASTVTTHFVYNAMGQLAVEYGGVPAEPGTDYLTGDHLGSTRVVTTQQGGVLARHDYLPFGEYITAGRESLAEYNASSAVNQKFTGKERDSEIPGNTLDYFGARYLSGMQGRFSTPDPLTESSKLNDPQTWNRYSYVANNPLRYIDPDGAERMDVVQNQIVRELAGGRITREQASERLTEYAPPWVGAIGLGLMTAGTAAHGGLLELGHSLWTGAVGYFLSPQGQRMTQTAIQAMAPPGPNPTLDLSAAAMNIGFRSGFAVIGDTIAGQLSNGTTTYVALAKQGNTLNATIGALKQVAGEAGAIKLLEQGILKVARSEGLKKVRVFAIGVNSRMAKVLKRKGFRQIEGTDNWEGVFDAQ